MAKGPPDANLSRRERQIMDAIYRLGHGTVSDVLDRLPSPPSYSAVRALMRILEEKGHLRHEQDGNRYVYYPVTPQDTARVSALRHLVSTFFGGSTEAAVAALLDDGADRLSDTQLDHLSHLIEQARKEEDQR
ncbi:MAG TPA: BlaI/MecI/CopY family transcriptional regulator [Longimicrobiaceae bacterium]|nr:BlaI/MecI/CopY family transcriptional regulator [Longimicrobiaceae bacterium]